MEQLTLKDFFPLIGTVVTITAGYYYLSLQANKNRRLKWIEDFRKEIADFSAIATSANSEFTLEKGYQLLKSTTVLTLYVFDSPEPPRQEFITKLRAFQTMIMEDGNANLTIEGTLAKTEIFGKRLAELMGLATTIIINEKRKI